MACTNYLTSLASRLVDCILAPYYLHSLPSYLKDSTAVSTPSIAPGSYLVTVDVNSNISITKCIVAIGLFCRFYRRFIFVRSGDLTELHSFLDQFNHLAPTIKLTWNISQTEVIFLVLVVQVDQDNQSLSIGAFSETAKLLPIYSVYPSHSKLSFIKAELMPCVRLSSKQSDFLIKRKKFSNSLRNRGYPRRFHSDVVVFSEILYSSHQRYLSRPKDRIKDV